jgi:hypothetical protein
MNRALKCPALRSEWMHNTPLAVQEILAKTRKFFKLLGLIISGAHKESDFIT